jgi:hypothetical protein
VAPLWTDGRAQCGRSGGPSRHCGGAPPHVRTVGCWWGVLGHKLGVSVLRPNVVHNQWRRLPAMTALTGTSGVAPLLSTATSGQPAIYTVGTCNSGLRAFFPGARLLYALSLGSATPLGGTLTITTRGHTAINTVLYVGTGCPVWDRPFGCVAGNDNAAGPACGANGLASSVAVATVTQPVYYLQLGGFAGAHVTSGLTWDHVAPTTRSCSGSRSCTRSSVGVALEAGAAVAAETSRCGAAGARAGAVCAARPSPVGLSTMTYCMTFRLIALAPLVVAPTPACYCLLRS